MALAQLLFVCLCGHLLASDFWEDITGQMGMMQRELFLTLQVLLAQSLCHAKKLPLPSIPSSFASRLSRTRCGAFS